MATSRVTKTGRTLRSVNGLGQGNGKARAHLSLVSEHYDAEQEYIRLRAIRQALGEVFTSLNKWADSLDLVKKVK